MSATRSVLDARAMGGMALICFIWALAQIAIKYNATAMSPILQIGIRSGGAAVLTVLLVRFQGKPLLTVPKGWLPGLVIGLLFSGEFFLMGEALRYTSASHVSIFLYTAPIFAALGLHFTSAQERLQGVQWVGVFLAFLGIAISFLGRDGSQNTALNPNMVFGDMLAILGGAVWGATTVVVRGSRLNDAPATETLFYQLVVAAVVLTGAAYVFEQDTVHWDSLLVVNLGFQIFVVSFLSLLLWFWLLRHYLASRLGVLSFLTPLFAVILGVVLLGERVDAFFAIGAACVVLGIILVNRTVKPADR